MCHICMCVLCQMYEHILELAREVYWIYGNVTCAGYPLLDIDTISETGDINVNSAMYLVVYGVRLISTHMVFSH